MKKHLLAIIFLFSEFIGANAQQHGTIYTDAVWNITTKNRCYYYRKWQNEDSIIAIQDYHEDGTLFQKGHAKSLKMDLWRAREGQFTCYDPRGVKVSDGKFVHGKREGKWKYYLASTDIPYQEMFYKNGRVQYESILTDDGKHKLSEVQYADGNEVMRKQYDSSGNLLYYAVLVNDQSIITNYYLNTRCAIEYLMYILKYI